MVATNRARQTTTATAMQDSARPMATATAHQRPLVVLLALLVVLAGLYSAPVAHQANPKAAHKQANQAA